MSIEFAVKLKKLEGKMNWTVIYVPLKLMNSFNTKGRVKVKGTVDGHKFNGTLLPSRNGHYLVYNKKLKELCNKERGELVTVLFEKDDRPDEVIVPNFINLAISGNEIVNEQFNKLPNYIKREKINYITSAKKEETKFRRLRKWIDELESL